MRDNTAYSRIPDGAREIDGIPLLRNASLANVTTLRGIGAARFASERQRIQDVVEFLNSDGLKASKPGSAPIYRRGAEFVSLSFSRPWFETPHPRRVAPATVDINYCIGGKTRRSFKIACETDYAWTLESLHVIADYVQRLLSVEPSQSNGKLQDFADSLAQQILSEMNDEQIAYAQEAVQFGIKHQFRDGCWIEIGQPSTIAFSFAHLHTRQFSWQKLFNNDVHWLANWVLDEIQLLPSEIMITASEKAVYFEGHSAAAQITLPSESIIDLMKLHRDKTDLPSILESPIS